MTNEDIQMPNGDFLKHYPDVTRVEVINGYENAGRCSNTDE